LNTLREKAMYRDYAKPVKQNLHSRLVVEGVCSETQTAQHHIPENCTAMKISIICNAPPPTPNPPTINQISSKFVAQFRNPIYRQYLPPIPYAS